MTEQEAIKEIKRWTNILMSAGNKCVSETAEAQDMAIKALGEIQNYKKIGTPEECQLAVEKQIAKKPEPIDYKKYMDSVKNANFLRGAYWCPGCKHVIRSGDYCDDCGQKLDWSDEE